MKDNTPTDIHTHTLSLITWIQLGTTCLFVLNEMLVWVAPVDSIDTIQ